MLNNNATGELKICYRCGNMFVFMGFGKALCAKCIEEEEEEFIIVKEYIMDHLSATIMEVAQETNVRVSRIKSFLKDGRLIIPDGSMVFINCELCEAPIKFGRVCRDCATTLSNEMKAEMNVNDFTIGEKPAPPSTSKMRFLDS